jgi:dihydroneopterin aldolase
MEREIFIKDWVLEASIGLYEQEKTKKQRLRLNLVFYQSGETKIEGVADIIDYDVHKQSIQGLVGSRHFELQEVLAEAIAAKCLTDPKMLRIRVQLEKIDIYQDCICGVTIERGK